MANPSIEHFKYLNYLQGYILNTSDLGLHYNLNNYNSNNILNKQSLSQKQLNNNFNLNLLIKKLVILKDEIIFFLRFFFFKSNADTFLPNCFLYLKNL